MSNTRKSERSEGKVARVPFGGPRLKLQLSAAERAAFDERGMVPRWFNDEGGRIERAQGAGYDFVSPDFATSLGQGALHQDGKDTESATRVSIVADRSTGMRSYLMEIPKEYYVADQEAKEAVNSQVDEALKSGGAGGADIENKYGPGVTYHR